MSWTRSAKNENGKFIVECHDWNGNLFYSGEFDNVQEADRAGEKAERRMTFEMQNGPMPTLEEIFEDMDDDELLKELGA